MEEILKRQPTVLVTVKKVDQFSDFGLLNMVHSVFEKEVANSRCIYKSSHVAVNSLEARLRGIVVYDTNPLPRHFQIQFALTNNPEQVAKKFFRLVAQHVGNWVLGFCIEYL